MSKTTKKKYVAQEVLNEFTIPEPPEQIVKVTGSRGNNLHDVALPDGTTFLASMPTKFRRNVWVKRGDFVVVVPIEEGGKVKAEIARILYQDQIRYIRANNHWPKEFDEECAPGNAFQDRQPSSSDSEEESSDNSDEEFVIQNPNRGTIRLNVESSSSSGDYDEEEREDTAEGRDGDGEVKSNETNE